MSLVLRILLLYPTLLAPPAEQASFESEICLPADISVKFQPRVVPTIMNQLRLFHHYHPIAALIIILAGALFPRGATFAQGEPAVQELTGRVETRSGILYDLPNLVEGDVLTFYMETTSGNLDPVMGIIDESGMESVIARGGFFEAVDEGIAAGRDPLVVIPELADEFFLVWDDDSGEGYAAALSFTVPADGDYRLFVTAMPPADTFGHFRLLIGRDAPEVLEGTAEPAGAEIAVAETTSPSAPAVQELTGEFTADKRSTFYVLEDIDAGDILYVFVEATSGDLAPTVILEDFGAKPIRSGNFSGQGREASFEHLFDDDAIDYRLNLSACCEGGEPTEGEYRLLVGLNEPDVLTGDATPTGRELIDAPTRVQVGVRLQQITSVDQKAENYGAVVTMQMRWNDPDLAFSPDACDCSFKIFRGGDFVDFAAENGVTWPEFTLFNQQGLLHTQNELVVVWPNGDALYFRRFSTTFQAPDFNFERFPFDTQQFYIRVDLLLPEEFFIFEDLEGFSDIGSQLGEEEWIIEEFGTEISSVTESTEAPVSRFSFGFTASRHLSFYITRIFIPILVILAVSWFTFFLKDYGKRVDVAAGNLLLFIAFNFTISGDLPRLGYLTFLDTILISTFVVTGLVVIFNVILKRLEIAGRGDLAQSIDRYTIWIYPLAYLAALGIVTIFFT